MSLSKEFTKGLLKENPLLSMLLGMCASLAVTSSVKNSLGMGLATTAVLVASNLAVSLLRKYIPGHIRIPGYIVVIATFVTIIEMFMHAYTPALYESLGIFIPLIVVNCIILGRAEAFASKNTPLRSLADGMGMGTGYTLALLTVGSIRELLGKGTVLGYSILGEAIQPAIIMILPPGAFLTLGCLLAILRQLQRKPA